MYGFSIKFDDLYKRERLVKLDTKFISELKEGNIELHNQLVIARLNKDLEKKQESELLIKLAPYVEDFIARLFNIEKELNSLKQRHNNLVNLYSCKRSFIQRRAAKLEPKQDGGKLEPQLEKLFGEKLTELSFANHVTEWLINKDEEKLKLAESYAAWALNTDEGKHKHRDGLLFKVPRKLDPYNLIPVETEIINGVTVMKLPKHHLKNREGFKLTDPGASLEKALDEVNYCIWCHHQGKDSCSKGLKEKEGDFKKSVFDVTLAGCPLEEKISEMHELKSQGVPIGALAVIIVDNPMCAATGHRICNDCMKSCIYQKQEPVNIPQAETRILKDVLELPYGFEIYSLLTRWNPLNIERPLPKPKTGYKVLVAGLGPAGFTLAHHLLNDGHTVIGIDGLKIEPLPENILFRPIKDCRELFEELDKRVQAGFGGVAEYGITVRWDKNFLKLIRLLLERRSHFAMYGGVRFGGTITYDTAFKLGFDHIALAMGAGKPTIVDMPNALVRGVRAASDFLMALQLTGAAKKNSIANLQLRLPVVVIGGGLTATDTATESLAYYPMQVEKFLIRYETLLSERGEESIRANWTEEEREIAEEFITHAKAIREERKKVRPDIYSLLKSWGGVKVVYRRKLTDAPSYRLNHEEVEMAMQEGMEFVENAIPKAVLFDEYGHVDSLKALINNEEKIIPAKTIFMAAGTSPNTVIEREDPKHFELDGKYFKAIDENGNHVFPEHLSRPDKPYVLMSINEENKAVSFFGDLHPSFAGNVVKAMGSAKQGYPVISRVLKKAEPLNKLNSNDFISLLNEQLIAKVHDVIRLTPTIVEVIVKAPLAASQFHPGQFYRLQNYEVNALKTTDTALAMEGLALTGAWVDKEKGLLSTIVLEMGGSSDLCAYFKKGERVILMGPTGTATETPAGETVMLVGGGLGNAVLFSIGKALRENGSKVLYFAGYRRAIDRYKVQEIEEASDVTVWCSDDSKFAIDRPQDKSFHGNIVQGMIAYAKGELGDMKIKMNEVDRMIVIGSDRMMEAVANVRHNSLKPYLKPGHVAIGSINSPMQCMMKEICAQCLQEHKDSETGKIHYVFSCSNQDQCLDKVSFPHLNERLKQNSLQEKLTAEWIDYSLKEIDLRESF